MSYTVAVAGASGYAGGELLRLLADHPEFEVGTVTGFSNAGERLIDVQPHLRSLAHLTLQPTEPDVLSGHDIVFVALPHGLSGELTSHLPDDVIVVDCGADHRLTSEQDWADYYGGDWFGAWDYGLPELPLADGRRQRDVLAGSSRIAVPGCNVTAITLGLAPAVAAGLVETSDLVAVLAVGPSGAGRALKTNLLAAELMGSASAYQVGGVHRHNPEIRQNLRAAGADDVSISFTPVLVPMSRGILATSTARLRPGVGLAELERAYAEAYGDESFVHVLPAGQFPRTADTVGANTCLVGIAVDERAGRLVAVSALDNLVKGTAGAAIQSTNIALGLLETLGLPLNGVAP